MRHGCSYLFPVNLIFFANANKIISKYIEYTTNPHEAFMKYNETRQSAANALEYFIEYIACTPDIYTDIHKRNNFLVIAITISSRSNSKIISNGSAIESPKRILYCHSIMVDMRILTHWGLVTPYGVGDLDWRHQAITWTNVDLSSVRSCGNHLRTLSSEDLKISISIARLKIPFLKSHQDLPGANELTHMRSNPNTVHRIQNAHCFVFCEIYLPIFFEVASLSLYKCINRMALPVPVRYYWRILVNYILQQHMK